MISSIRTTFSVFLWILWTVLTVYSLYCAVLHQSGNLILAFHFGIFWFPTLNDIPDHLTLQSGWSLTSIRIWYANWAWGCGFDLKITCKLMCFTCSTVLISFRSGMCLLMLWAKLTTKPRGRMLNCLHVMHCDMDQIMGGSFSATTKKSKLNPDHWRILTFQSSYHRGKWF